jgi:hypothetical protein
LAALFAALFVLSGCSAAEMSALYSLPQAPKEYLQLQTLIDDEIRSGSEYSAPTAGSLRQSIQLTDLDGDGVNEALAFLRNGALQPEICVYRKSGDAYTAAARIVGNGTAIGRVEYQDLNGDGVFEILVSWEVNAEMRLLKAYAISGWKPAVLLTASCADFLIGDLDANGVSDILALNLDASGGKVDMYTINKLGDVARRSAKLSASLKTAERFRIAPISGKLPAVVVEGQYSSEDSSHLLTDLIVYSGGELKNITLSSLSGDSAAQRHYAVYSTDIDGDGTLDVPFAERAISPGGSEYYVFDWYSYAGNGERVLCASTYHDYADGWFFEIPDDWKEGLAIRRESADAGARAIVFSMDDPETGEMKDRLTIYTFTDENRTERAVLDGRFALLSSGTVVYAARLAAAAGETEKQAVADRFHLISSEFNTGTL